MQRSRVRRRDEDDLARLFDPLVGFLIWGIHFVVVYVVQAVACVLGVGASQAILVRTGLVALTLAALALVAWHGWRASLRRHDPRERFMSRITLGHDGLAAVGIAWQLYPLLMLALCR